MASAKTFHFQKNPDLAALLLIADRKDKPRPRASRAAGKKYPFFLRVQVDQEIAPEAGKPQIFYSSQPFLLADGNQKFQIRKSRILLIHQIHHIRQRHAVIRPQRRLIRRFQIPVRFAHTNPVFVDVAAGRRLLIHHIHMALHGYHRPPVRRIRRFFADQQVSRRIRLRQKPALPRKFRQKPSNPRLVARLARNPADLLKIRAQRFQLLFLPAIYLHLVFVSSRSHSPSPFLQSELLFSAIQTALSPLFPTIRIVLSCPVLCSKKGAAKAFPALPSPFSCGICPAS